MAVSVLEHSHAVLASIWNDEIATWENEYWYLIAIFCYCECIYITSYCESIYITSMQEP